MHSTPAGAVHAAVHRSRRVLQRMDHSAAPVVRSPNRCSVPWSTDGGGARWRGLGVAVGAVSLSLVGVVGSVPLLLALLVLGGLGSAALRPVSTSIVGGPAAKNPGLAVGPSPPGAGPAPSPWARSCSSTWVPLRDRSHSLADGPPCPDRESVSPDGPGAWRGPVSLPPSDRTAAQTAGHDALRPLPGPRRWARLRDGRGCPRGSPSVLAAPRLMTAAHCPASVRPLPLRDNYLGS